MTPFPNIWTLTDGIPGASFRIRATMVSALEGGRIVLKTKERHTYIQSIFEEELT